MGAWIKRTQHDYTMAFKLAVVEQIEKGVMLTHVRSRVTMFIRLCNGYDCYQNALAERVNGILKKPSTYIRTGH